MSLPKCRIPSGVAASLIAGLAALALTGAVLACAYPLANSLLDGGDAEALQAPLAIFRTEIDALVADREPVYRHLPPPESGPNRHRQRPDPVQQTAQIDLRELRTVLAEQGDPDLEEHCDAYVRLRHRITRFCRQRTAWQAMRRIIELHERHDWTLSDWRVREWREHGLDPEATTPPVLPAAPVPDWLPVEFALYLEGAVLYHRDQPGEAVRCWQRLLALPRDKRRFRTTWGTYMIGRALLETDPAAATEWFRRVRQRVDEGFADALGLAAASYGWEARACLRTGDPAAALSLYLRQYHAGDEGALVSLRWTAFDILESGPDALAAVVGQHIPRQVLVAYVLSRSGPAVRLREPADDGTDRFVTHNGARLLLDAVLAHPLDTAEEAERFAWLAYQAGDYAHADRWLALAPADAPMSRWLRAKLLLRDGKVPEAAAELSDLVRQVPPRREVSDWRWVHSEAWESDAADFELWDEPLADRTRGELGVLLLSQDDYTGALHALLLGHYADDAACIAERILTVEEFQAYVDARWPTGDTEHGRFLRNLLARRLTCMGRWKAARPYYTPDEQKLLDAYIRAIRTGHDRSLPRRRRAAAFWRAATLARGPAAHILASYTGPTWYSSARPADQVEPPAVRRGAPAHRTSPP
ncbi:MAG: hypothetical protein ACOCX4_06780 [Planctomycetota bacterium]